MGKSKTPAPDPRLTERQIRSMDVQDEAVREIMANTREFAPLQREQMQFGLQTQRSAFAQSQEDREWALGKRKQLDRAQAPLLQEAAQFDEASRGEQLRGQAFGDISQAFEGARGLGSRALTRTGVNPSAGRYAAFQSQIGTQQALAKAQAGQKVREAAKAEGLTLRNNAANMMAGYPAMASGLTGQQAGFGMGGINVMNSGLQGMNAGWAQAASGGGAMGQNAGSMYGQQSSAYQQGQAQDSQTQGAIVGAIATAAMAMSDRRAKTDITRVGETEYGLPIYTFHYKAGGPLQIGVMADEVKLIRPEAYIPGGAGNGYDAVDYSKI